MNEIKVLVVDDSAFNRQTIRKILERDEDITVVDTAVNGVDAISKVTKLRPDVVTLDLEMPGMDGFSFLRWMMKENPIPIIIVSSIGDSKTVFKALELGAVDFVIKPTPKASKELESIEKDLLRKIKTIPSLKMDRLKKNLSLLDSAHIIKESGTTEYFNAELVAIGSSTGGPAALQAILTRLPGQLPAGIVISQHMPAGFTRQFAKRLDKLSELQIKEAEHGDVVGQGKVFICPGGHHMHLKKRTNSVVVNLKEATEDDRYTPSIDTMMVSAADVYGQNLLGVVLTGMGYDGKRGMVEIKSKGGYTIVESEETSVVFGMPNEVIGAGVADKVLPLDAIPKEILKRVKKADDGGEGKKYIKKG